jgi:uncharacterized Zn finger protein
MSSVSVECLGCGCQRVIDDDGHTLATGSCPRCGYVGWAHATALTETDRRALREIPVSLRPIENPLERLAWR